MIDTAIDELHNETETLMWSFSNYSWLPFPFSIYWAWLSGQMYSDLNCQTSSENHHVVHSSMHNSLWIIDGLHLPLQNRWNADIGNAYYSGWKGQFLASQVVVECDPRPMHQDGGKAEWVLKTCTQDFLIYLEITEWLLTGISTVTSSWRRRCLAGAFCRRIPGSGTLENVERFLNANICSLRQAVKWRNGTLNSIRLQLPVTVKSGKRTWLIELCLLFKVRYKLLFNIPVEPIL